MKKLIVGFIAGFIFATVSAVYADEGLQKIEAYLRPTLPITLNGQAVTLEGSPVMYNGATYLKLRDLAELTGLVVNWNDKTQSVELGTLGTPKGAMTTMTTPTPTVTPTETTYNGLKAITYNGETYFSLGDYSKNFEPISWGFDSSTNTIFLAKHVKNSTEILETYTSVNKDEVGATVIYNGSTYVNIKYYSKH